MVILVPRWKWMGSFILVLLTLLLLLPRCATGSHLYVALGDVFSSGIIIEQQRESSFVDFLGERLISEHKIDSYSKLFTSQSMDSSDLLQLVTQDSYANDGTQMVRLSSILEDSTLITVSIGLNDWISHMVYDSELHTLAFDYEIMERTLSIMQLNVFDSLEAIKVHAPNATIIVTGYYFIFPFIAEPQKPLITALYQQFQASLQQSAMDAEVLFVTPIATASNEMFLDPFDIYLSSFGHQTVASKLWDVLQ